MVVALLRKLNFFLYFANTTKHNLRKDILQISQKENFASKTDFKYLFCHLNRGKLLSHNLFLR